MGKEKSREIIEKSKDRARFLTDYLCNGIEGTMEVRRKDFFVWFKQERYSWYAIMVLEECLKIADAEDSKVPEDIYIGMVVYLLGLYKENGRKKQHKELCDKTILRYGAGERTINEFQSVWFKNIVRLAGNEASVVNMQETKRVIPNAIETVVNNKEREYEEITASYIVSKPLNASEECAKFFVGREVWISDYCKRLRNGVEGILVFYGQYRVGKSSVLENLKYYLKEDFEIISVSMGDMINPGHFYREIVKRLREGEERKKKYKELVRSFTERMDAESDELKVSVLEEFIDTVDERLKEEGSNKKLLLFMDEFSGLINKESFVYDEQFLNVLRKKVNEQKLQVVITGSEVMRQCMQNWANFFGKCNLEKLEYLEEKPTHQLLEEAIRMSDGTSRWDSDRELLHRIYNLTKGQPSITQIIGDMVVKKLNAKRQNMVDASIINEIENEILTAEYMDWKLRFDPLLDCGNERWKKDDVIAVCAQVERAYREKISQKELLEHFNNDDMKELYKVLLDRGIIKKNLSDDIPQVYMELFGKWCYCWDMK